MSQSVDIAQSGAPAGERRQESQLIGSILETDADDGADLVRRPFFSNASAASAISRSMSAPPVSEPFGTGVDASVQPDDPRLSSNYYSYYYQQQTAQPMLNWGNSGQDAADLLNGADTSIAASFGGLDLDDRAHPQALGGDVSGILRSQSASAALGANSFGLGLLGAGSEAVNGDGAVSSMVTAALQRALSPQPVNSAAAGSLSLLQQQQQAAVAAVQQQQMALMQKQFPDLGANDADDGSGGASSLLASPVKHSLLKPSDATSKKFAEFQPSALAGRGAMAATPALFAAPPMPGALGVNAQQQQQQQQQYQQFLNMQYMQQLQQHQQQQQQLLVQQQQQQMMQLRQMQQFGAAMGAMDPLNPMSQLGLMNMQQGLGNINSFGANGAVMGALNGNPALSNMNPLSGAMDLAALQQQQLQQQQQILAQQQMMFNSKNMEDESGQSFAQLGLGANAGLGGFNGLTQLPNALGGGLNGLGAASALGRMIQPNVALGVGGNAALNNNFGRRPPQSVNQLHINPQQQQLLQRQMVSSGSGHPLSAALGEALDESTPSSPSRGGSLVDELRLNKASHKVSLTDLVNQGLVIELAMDQHGSRFIQQKLEVAADAEKQLVFEQLAPETLRLCTDVFGNYVIQKFLEFGLAAHRAQISSALVGNVLQLSMQMYGCRVVQKALEVASDELQSTLVGELAGHVRQCVKDQNGNHVIQKCIERVPARHIQFIVDDFSGQIFPLATHPYGCRVIQRLLEHCQESQKAPIMAEILEHVLDLIQDQYGNYVIQHVLEHGLPWQRSAIVASVQSQILALTKHKFASNVVEKCFVFGSDDDRTQLVDEVIGSNTDGPAPIAAMVRDQYANYVVQKIIDVTSGPVRLKFVEGLKLKVPGLRKITYGKHIISRIEKITGKPF